MNDKRIRVHPNFEKMLKDTLEEINKHTETKLTMIELTKILSTNTNGTNAGVLTLRMPIVIIPTKRTRGRPRKPLHQRFLNIVLEDEPR